MGICGSTSNNTNTNNTYNNVDNRNNNLNRNNSNRNVARNNSNRNNTYVDDELLDFLSLNHPMNINRKYTMFFKILENKYSGTDIFTTSSYVSNIIKQELDIKRSEFWGFIIRN